MGNRSKSKQQRCASCGLHLELCLCFELPRIELESPLVVVRHAAERFKPTSTAPLLPAVFDPCTLVTYGAWNEAFDSSALEDVDLLLYPEPESIALDDLPVSVRRHSRLVVLDGTWSQCSRMARRVPQLRDLPRVRLPDGPPSQWDVRRSPDPQRLCTFEAVLRAVALRQGESPDLEHAEQCFRRITERALSMRSRPSSLPQPSPTSRAEPKAPLPAWPPEPRRRRVGEVGRRPGEGGLNDERSEP